MSKKEVSQGSGLQNMAVIGMDKAKYRKLVSLLQEVYEWGLVDGFESEDKNKYYEMEWKVPRNRAQNIQRIARSYSEIRTRADQDEFKEYYNSRTPYIRLEGRLST